jgi:hypothetical protein
MPKAFWISGFFLFALNFAVDKVFATSLPPALNPQGPFVEEQSSAATQQQVENSVKISKSITKINLETINSRSVANEAPETTPDLEQNPKHPEIIRQDN